jgi:hypothetical protein
MEHCVINGKRSRDKAEARTLQNRKSTTAVGLNVAQLCSPTATGHNVRLLLRWLQLLLLILLSTVLRKKAPIPRLQFALG